MCSRGGRSFAIENNIRSYFPHLAAYALLVSGALLMPLGVPFWLYFPLVGSLGYAYSKMAGTVSRMLKRAHSARGRIILTPLQSMLSAPERFPGLWLGSFMTCVIYCMMCLGYAAATDEQRAEGGAGWETVGLDSVLEERKLFTAAMLLVVVTVVTWARMVLMPAHPGLVDTRHRDFDTVLQQSLALNGAAPDSSLYCRTTLLRKPVRSKFCSSSGFVVARFDHYCVWLNTAVGYGNHRVFMLFLLSHVAANMCFIALLIKALIRANDKTGPAFVLGTLLSQNYFFVTVLLVYVLAITCGLTFLLVEQSTNIVRNVTTNERINRSRYAWMQGPDGRPLNRFDRGPVRNVLDFLLVPGVAVNYFTVMDIPEVAASKHPRKRRQKQQEGVTTGGGQTVNAMHSAAEKDHEQCDDHGHDHGHGHSHSHSGECNHNHSDRHL